MDLTTFLLIYLAVVLALFAPLYIAYFLVHRGRYRQALRWYRSCYAVLRHLPGWKGSLAFNVCACYVALGDFERARPYAEEALRDARKRNSKRVLPLAQAYMGVLHCREGNYEEAERLFDEALAAPRLSKRIRAVLTIDGASVYLNLGRFEEAERLLQEGIAASQTKPDAQAIALGNLSLCHYYRHKPEEALATARRAEQLPARTALIAPYLQFICVRYLAELGRLEEAKQAESRLLPQIPVLPDYLRGGAYRAVAYLALKTGDLDRARDYAEQANRMDANPNAQVDSLLTQAEVFAARANAHRAESLCSEALRMNVLDYHKQRARQILARLHTESHPVLETPTEQTARLENRA